ncbi:MAG TPA: hypothetical protein VHB48_06155 [Chitinophagaceae bacterium]|jgi:hypothetical protein|nr:hypothetical protein [Chitinophagaceae bacterium]
MKFLRKNILLFTGIAIGAAGGFFYWKFVGCNHGCPIQSNPYRMTAYGAVMGGLIFSMFQSSSAKG